MTGKRITPPFTINQKVRCIDARPQEGASVDPDLLSQVIEEMFEQESKL